MSLPLHFCSFPAPTFSLHVSLLPVVFVLRIYISFEISMNFTIIHTTQCGSSHDLNIKHRSHARSRKYPRVQRVLALNQIIFIKIFHIYQHLTKKTLLFATSSNRLTILPTSIHRFLAKIFGTLNLT